MRTLYMIIISLLCVLTAAAAAESLSTMVLTDTTGLITGASIPGNELDYTVSTAADGSRILILDWDGSDSAPDVFDTGGLGGVDFNRFVHIDIPAIDRACPKD